MRCVVVACLVVYRLTEDGGGEDERNDLSGRERGSSSTRGAEGRNRESLSQPSYLIAFASLWVLAARWNTIEARTIYVHVQDRACKPVLVPCTNAIRRLGNTGIPYQRWDHRQDWQVLCRHRPIRKENRTAEQGYIYIYTGWAASGGEVILHKNDPTSPSANNDAYPSSILRGNREHLFISVYLRAAVFYLLALLPLHRLHDTCKGHATR